MGNHKTFLAFLLICTTLPAVSWAQNDQTAVIGLGVGGHTFSETDDVRADWNAGGGGLGAVHETGMGHLFGEWYALEEIGFGVHYLYMKTSSYTGVAPPVNEIEREIEIHTILLTANWVPFGATGYTRLGLIAGAGQTEYQVTLSVGSDSDSWSTSGPAMLAGAYLDWGGEGFGARFGMNYLSTQLDDLNGADADASGRNLYLDLRWAFD